MLARLGADQCIQCGSDLTSDWRQRYCSACEPQLFTATGHSLGDPARNDREAVGRLLNAAADALRIG